MPYPRFTPTEEQRRDVALMAAVGLPQREIAQVVINPNTGKPVKTASLVKIFRDELESAKTTLRKKILQQYIKKLEDGDWRAIEFGMKYCLGLGNGNVTLSLDADPSSAGTRGIEVRFIAPDPARWKEDPVPGPYDTRPIGRSEMRQEATGGYPTLLQHEPSKPGNGRNWMK